jgi:hypothetical protein
MRNLLRRPLTWMVIGECIVVAALTLVAWNLIASAVQSGGSGAAPQTSLSISNASPSPPPTLPSIGNRPARLQLPGLNLNSAFWRERLGQLNRDQVFIEELEWRIIHTAMDAVNRYMETVVLPSISRAEGVR